jgi:cyclopropane-fatty-acyl-phospholipid synthase
MNGSIEAVGVGSKRRLGLLESIGKRALFNLLNKWETGSVVITLPDGESVVLGVEGAKPKATMVIHKWRFFSRIALGGDIAFGESFVDGDWHASDLTELLFLFSINQEVADDRGAALSRIGEFFHTLSHKMRSNTLTGSRKNISAHYDLSNDLYTQFLDKEMQYSCALWRTPKESLEDAQLNKMYALLNKLQLKRGMTVLEIGSGWGKLAILAAKNYGVTVKSLTLSQEQQTLAVKHAKEAGVSENVEFVLQDYREELGRYDRVLSVEMIEAVGHENLGTYFQTIDRVLKKDGLAVIQAITIPDHKYETYRKSCDWIQKYIFPGAVCPSLGAMQNAMTDSSKLIIEHVENIGIHYARTLKEWRERFNERWDDISKLGFDDQFKKMWEYYLSYCEAGYKARILGNLHVVLTRPGNRTLPNASEME